MFGQLYKSKNKTEKLSRIIVRVENSGSIVFIVAFDLDDSAGAVSKFNLSIYN